MQVPDRPARVQQASEESLTCGAGDERPTPPYRVSRVRLKPAVLWPLGSQPALLGAWEYVVSR